MQSLAFVRANISLFDHCALPSSDTLLQKFEKVCILPYFISKLSTFSNFSSRVSGDGSAHWSKREKFTLSKAKLYKAPISPVLQIKPWNLVHCLFKLIYTWKSGLIHEIPSMVLLYCISQLPGRQIWTFELSKLYGWVTGHI